MRRAILLAGLALVASCGDWPDLGLEEEAAGYPRLVPFDEVVAPGEMAGEAAAEAAEADAALLERAEALRARAADIGAAEAERDAFDALRRRVDRGD